MEGGGGGMIARSANIANLHLEVKIKENHCKSGCKSDCKHDSSYTQ